MATDQQKEFVEGIAVQHAGALRRFLARRLRHGVSDVPDLVQEVFLQLLRVEQPDSIRSPEAYLFTIAKHVLYQHKARQNTAAEAVDIVEVLAQLEDLPERGPEARLAVRQRIEELNRALAELPRKAYVTLILNRVVGLTLADVAVHIGVSRPMAKKYLAKALSHCRQRDVDLG